MPGIKKSFKIHFNEYDPTIRFHGLKKLNFHNSFKDPAIMREMVGYDVFEAAGSPASRTSHIKLYVTVPDTYVREFFGVYVSVEQVNKDYLIDRYPENAGNLYKAGRSGADFFWRGWDKSAYTTPVDAPPYEKKTNEIEDDWTDFLTLLDVINNTPDGTFKAEIEQVFNVDGFLTHLAVNTVTVHMDSVSGRGANWYIYHNMVTDKFEFIPWDLNMVFGNFRGLGPTQIDADAVLALDVYSPTLPGTQLLVNRILNVTEYMDTYVGLVRDLVNGAFTPAAMHPAIDDIYNRIKADVYLDTHKQYSNAAFDACIEQDIPDNTDPRRTLGMKPFVTERVANIISQIGP
jgi:spore coat protein CotH